jgi:hypothetical protein
MAAITYKTAYAKGEKPTPVANGSEVLAVRFEFDLSAILLDTDIIRMGFVPANHKVVDWTLDCDDLSDQAAGKFSLGILNAADAINEAASGGAAWVVDSVLAQGGGFVRALTKTHTRMVVSRTADQKVGLVMTAACTGTATGKIGLTLYMTAG